MRVQTVSRVCYLTAWPKALVLTVQRIKKSRVSLTAVDHNCLQFIRLADLSKRTSNSKMFSC